MATVFSKVYDVELEDSMRLFHESLPEKDRRRYAAIEARKLGHGGQSYIASVLGCHRDTVAEGMKELQSLPEPTETAQRIRRPGGGRKKATEKQPQLKNDYVSNGNPVFSIDTKKKELLGTLYRPGRVYTQQAFEAFDHDFPSWATGKIVPHGIWDPIRNHGHLNLGLSCDTSEFACDSLRWFWNRIGKHHYRDATSILLLGDAGGSNNCRHYIFKQDLQRLANEIGVEIRMAHYPTYCSKFNPIERRFFSQVTRACQGVLFDRLATVVELMRKTATRTGLTTTVHVVKKIYETGRAATQEFRDNMPIKFDSVLPRWNYAAIPQA